MNVDTGLFGLSEGGLLATVQDLVVQPIWMLLVWSVRSASVVLEWCFSLDPFSRGVGARLTGGLRTVEGAVTYPALGVALACAAVLAVHHGIMRRRAAQAVAGAASAALMIVVTLSIVGQPLGTVGEAVNESNRLAAGAMAAASGAVGDPTSLGAALDDLDARLLQRPWCYLEFGDVSWCMSPRSADRPLDRAALAVAAEAVLLGECRRGPRRTTCRSGDGPLVVVDDVERARTIGELFLAFPANGSARNDAERSPSLLNTLCGSEDPDACSGPTAQQAEFRTASGTWPRVGGLLLIAVGVAGVLALIGVIALRLLVATALTIILLIAAPFVAVAPAFGERGRGVFWTWIERLAAASVAKLIYAFVLGGVFAVLSVTAELAPHRWLADWLLTAGLSWGMFLKRNSFWPRTAKSGGSSTFLRRASQAAGLAWIFEHRLDRDPNPKPPARADTTARIASPPLPAARTDVRRNTPLVETEFERRRRRLHAATDEARASGDRRREVSLRGRLARLEADEQAFAIRPPEG
ncbi:MAG TPA: hypothetical protein VMA83_12230 [Solirubrobacteraceae bacterium]|nr:hypothetical protein [Solirubrobacteraceae bacterium]